SRAWGRSAPGWWSRRWRRSRRRCGRWRDDRRGAGARAARRAARGGRGGGAWAGAGGFVVALTARGVPLMPNGIALARDAPPAGTRVTVVARETWDPTLRLPPRPPRRRGAGCCPPAAQ